MRRSTCTPHWRSGPERWRIDANYAVKIDSSLGLLGVLLEPCTVVAKAWEQVLTVGQRAFWEATLKTAIETPGWNAELIKNCWSPFYLEGPDLRQYLAEEQQDFATRLAQLGLLRAASPTAHSAPTSHHVTQRDLNP